MENQVFHNTTQHTHPATAPMKPKNWMTESILVTIIPCCLCNLFGLLGIVAIVYASKVNNLYFAGRYAEAEQASKDAKMWVLITLGLVLLAIVGYFVWLWIAFGGVGGYLEMVREMIETLESGGSIW